ALWATGWQAPASLRALLVGGDQLHPVAAERLGCALYNHYGPTENAVVATWGRVSEGGALPPIGEALPHVQAYVLNRWGQPVPAGVVGELYLGGAGVARGYLGQAATTAEKFVPDPFSGVAGARLYRTGDLVRWRGDGQLAFIGRRDGQVQLRGIRIELGEIEAVLGQHAEVAEAVVIARETAPNTKQLIAFVVREQTNKETKEQGSEQRTENKEQSSEMLPSPAATEAEASQGLGKGLGVRATSQGLSSTLRQYLQDRLPEYMIPASIVLLDGMPLTPNGKIDRRALDERAVMESGELEYVGPRTPVETQLAAIWQQLLRPTNPTPIGIHDNFFALGGHSLLATQCVFQIQQTLHVELPLRSLFNAPTIAEYAEVIQTSRATATTPQPTIGSLDRRRYRIKGSPAS
ncbi:MAG TPA: non-ribosomal peptide synthetase, partial [Herpetosiphonaceae bacterium]